MKLNEAVTTRITLVGIWDMAMQDRKPKGYEASRLTTRIECRKRESEHEKKKLSTPVGNTGNRSFKNFPSSSFSIPVTYEAKYAIYNQKPRS